MLVHKNLIPLQKSIHGDCEVAYAVSAGQIVKSVSHMADCKNRKYRLIDDWRGYRCDIDYKNPQIKKSVDGLYSMANTVYKIDKVGGKFVIKGICFIIFLRESRCKACA